MAAFFYHFFFMSLIALASVSVFAIVVYRLGLFSDEESDSALSWRRSADASVSDDSLSVEDHNRSSSSASIVEEGEVPGSSIPAFSRSKHFSSQQSEGTDIVEPQEDADVGFHVVTAAASAVPNTSFQSRRTNYRRVRAAMGNVVVKGLELDYLSLANAMTAIQTASRYDAVSASGLRPNVSFSRARSAQRSAIDVGCVILFANDEENFTYGFDGDSSNTATKSIANVNSFGVA